MNKLLNILLLNKFAKQNGGTTPTGTINITENGTVDVTNYAEANVNVVSEYNGKFITTAMVSQYAGIIRFIEETPSINVSGLQTTDLGYMFSNAENLVTINLFDTSNVTGMNRFCNNCQKLVNVPEFDTTRVTNLVDAFAACPSLSNNSLNNILAMCYKSACTNNKNLQKIGLTSEQADICETLPNWQAYLDGGWFKGY